MFFRRRGTGGFVPPTPTTPRYWVGGTGTWDQATTTHWATTSGGAGGASVPTALNDVIFDALSGTGTCTCNASAPCNSLTSTASNISFTHNASVTITVGSSHNAGPSNKAVDLTGLVTYTKGGGSSSAWSFVASVATQQTINFGAGPYSVGSLTWNGSGGSWLMSSAISSGGVLTLTAGSLDTGNHNTSSLSFPITGSATRSLTLGTSVVTLTGSSNGQWDATTTTALTFSGASSTITLTGSGALASLFRGGGLSYGTVNITGTGTIGITGANTFVAFTRSNAVAIGLTLPHGVTQTIASAAGLTISGTSGNVVTVNSDLAANAATISIASGTVNANFLSLQDSAATGGATFHAGAGSTNVSGNSGWLFP